VGAVAFVSAAHAEVPRVTIGGALDVQMGVTSEKAAYDSTSPTVASTSGNDRRGYSIGNDTELKFSIDGKSDAGLGYGAVIELEADTNNQRDSSDTNADKTFLYLQSGWGRFELGANSGASQAMKVDAATFARATGGIQGDWWRYASIPQGTSGTVTSWIIKPELLVEHGTYTSTTLSKSAEDANKITYYSPRFSGFQVGLSFAPDTGEIGQVAGNSLGSSFTSLPTTTVEDLFTGGINYKNQFRSVGVALSATGQTGSAKKSGVAQNNAEDLTSYAFGGNLSYRGFTFGGSWGTWENSLEPKDVTAASLASPGFSSNRDKSFWNLGAAYDFGPFGVSATYFDSKMEDGAALGDEKFQNWVLGADYTLAPGLVPYVEVSFFDFKTNATAAAVSPTANNSGTVLLLGTQLTF
jgi:predicted porin